MNSIVPFLGLLFILVALEVWGLLRKRGKAGYEMLNGTVEEPFAADLVSWPDCTCLLSYLEKRAGIKMLAKSSYFITGDYFAEFTFKTYRFQVITPLSSPWLVALKGCPEEVFTELLEHVKKYLERPYVTCFMARLRYFILPWKPGKSDIS